MVWFDVWQGFYMCVYVYMYKHDVKYVLPGSWRILRYIFSIISTDCHSVTFIKPNIIVFEIRAHFISISLCNLELLKQFHIIIEWRQGKFLCVFNIWHFPGIKQHSSTRLLEKTRWELDWANILLPASSMILCHLGPGETMKSKCAHVPWNGRGI